MKLYLASSWRNPYQPNAVALLRGAGHEVYDFMHPPGGDHLGFSWAEVDPDWRQWDVDRYLAGIEHPVAVAGFESDFNAMQWADAGVLLLPCGRSAHLEAGWFAGQGKPLWIVLDEAELPPAQGQSNPELMYRMATGIVRDLGELLAAIADHYTEPKCRVCGCSEFAPCDEGCWWVPDPALAVKGAVCSSCAPVINPLESWDGHVPCPTCMGVAAHACPDKAKHDDINGRVRVVYTPPEPVHV